MAMATYAYLPGRVGCLLAAAVAATRCRQLPMYYPQHPKEDVGMVYN